MTMIETVARVICRVGCLKDKDMPCHGSDCEAWDMFTEEAKAAIEAMREPTDEMLLAAAGKHLEIDRIDGTLDTRVGRGSRTLEVHTAMINAALKEE